MDDDYSWVLGGRPDLFYGRFIAHGGSGDVHEVNNTMSRLTELGFLKHRRQGKIGVWITLANEETFARKVIRSSEIRRQDIDREANNIAKLLEYGEHENIVRILDYGWALNFYFIDMELCDFTLRDYIKYHGDGGSIGFIDANLSAPVLATKDCSFLERVHNMWAIGSHIASGLEFLHSHKHVHRDLKPANGMHFSTHL